MSRRRRGDSAAFSLLEAVIATAVLTTMILSLALALTEINRWASAARLKTLALALAQQKVDEVLTTSWLVRGTRPAVLAAGTATDNNLPLNNDVFNDQTGLSSVFTALDSPLAATRVTQITDLPPRGLRATVTVSFTYRSHTYQTSLTTIRVTDDI